MLARMNIEERVRRLEYLMLRLATASPDVLPADCFPLIADIVREIDERPEGDDPVFGG
jgi:hypothetical protein